MTCSACGAALPDEAGFCEECGRPVAQPDRTPPAFALPPPPVAHTPYGAIEGRPTGRTFAFTIVGVVALCLGLLGFWYYKTAEDRRLTRLDHPILSAELDALSAATETVQRLAEAAVPETKPGDFASLVSTARVAVARYHEQSKLATPLPSGRPWPGQFTRCSAYLDEAIKNYPIVGFYLEQRATIKDKKPGATADTDQNILNVADIGGEPLGKLTDTLQELEQQRAGVTWVYEPQPKGSKL